MPLGERDGDPKSDLAKNGYLRGLLDIKLHLYIQSAGRWYGGINTFVHPGGTKCTPKIPYFYPKNFCNSIAFHLQRKRDALWRWSCMHSWLHEPFFSLVFATIRRKLLIIYESHQNKVSSRSITMSTSQEDSYVGPAYELTKSVINLRKLPRFGYGYDFTAVLSPNQAAQVDYTSGLMALFIFLFIFFLLWSITLLVFKIMGPGNAGFLSGHPFVIPDPVDDQKNIHKRPLRVRIVFLVVSVLLMIFAFLFVIVGVSNVSNATTTMDQSIQTAEELMQYTNQIASELAEVGRNSIELRDSAVQELKNICPNNPNVAEMTGIDIMPIAEKAKTDLTMLATFISQGLQTLKEVLTQLRSGLNNVDDTLESVDFWGWHMKLLAAGLFILPSFLIVGVGLVMLDLDVKPYQKALTYFIMPLFTLTVIVTYVFCSVTLPAAAASSDACTGGGQVAGGPDDTLLTVYRNLMGDDTGIIMPLFTLTVIVTYVFCSVTLPAAAASSDACTGGGQVAGGPDDTLLTVYRNLMGDDTGIMFMFAMFYTQRCQPNYYPFGILDRYFNDLDAAITSTGKLAKVDQIHLFCRT